MDERMLKGALSHIQGELEFPNIVISLSHNYEEMQKAHDSIHEFIYLAPLCLPSESKVSWHPKSAFLIYQFEAFCQAHRSFLEVLSGYYNAGHVLLRSTFEVLLKGAFWECLAHKEFRDKAEIVKKKPSVKIGNSGRTILDWLNDVIKQKPSIEEELEKTSARIFDKIAPIFEDSTLRKLVPPLRVVIEQLAEWGIFESIHDSINKVYGIYGDLSAEVHVIPDKMDIWRRLLSAKDLFETDVISDELSKFTKVLKEVVDIGIVVELNILSDWINQDKEVRTKLRERLAIVEDLGLKFSSEKLMRLLG